ncbi:hypothetical protein ACH9L7_07150 [Haloferax sp. S1W]|uniref:hypothetical protein n=1 Tax=Haloferax sp. S1W TaxID=3377110 RepID=UPI0037CC0F06
MMYTCFDPSSGSGSEFEEIGDYGTSGFCKAGDFGWVAVYPDPDRQTLIVQISEIKWDLYASGTTVIYNHHYNDENTYFKISDEENTFDITYEAWWKDVPHFEANKWAASREEENSHEDIFGYILMLWQNEDKKENWIELWSEHLPN